ncbi:hypothetical protein D3C77_494340 [compost metagenome]
MEHRSVVGDWRNAARVQSSLDPWLRISSHLLGADGHDVTQSVREIVFVAIGRKDRSLDGQSIVAHVACVMWNQNVRR